MGNFIVQLITVIGTFLLNGFILYLCWNPTISEIFSLPEISYNQALVVCIVAGIFTGSKEIKIKNDTTTNQY